MSKTLRIAVLALAASSCLGVSHGFAQLCTNRVTHLSGTQTVNCSSVTVTSEGTVQNTTSCTPTYPIFPYWALGDASSYTFTFNPPVSGVTLDVYGMNNADGEEEEITMEINGVPTPFTSPGVGSGCLSPLVVVGGALRACTDCLGSSRDIPVNVPITSIKIINTYLAGSPNGSVFSLFFCCATCVTDAGVLAAGPLNLCGPNALASLAPATQTELDPNDILQYILHTDPDDPLGSDLATAATPTFAFNAATMTLGTTYYISAAAGNNLNGNVDPNDPCLDFSNASAVVWRPLPAATLSLSNPDVCSGDCTFLTINFTGTPPFFLDFTVPWGTFSVPSNTNTATIDLCTPIGGPPGPVTVQAIAVTDAFCVCN